jgi:hypothetical protein
MLLYQIVVVSFILLEVHIMTPSDFSVYSYLKKSDVSLKGLMNLFGGIYCFDETLVLLARAICTHEDCTKEELQIISKHSNPEIAAIGKLAVDNFPEISLSFQIESLQYDFNGIFYFSDKIMSRRDIKREDLELLEVSCMNILTAKHGKDEYDENYLNREETTLMDNIQEAIWKQN